MLVKNVSNISCFERKINKHRMEFASIEAASANRYNYMAAYQIIASKLISQFTLLLLDMREEKKSKSQKMNGKNTHQQ